MRCMGVGTDTLHYSEYITMKLTPMQCAQCDRLLPSNESICAHCDAKYAQERALETGAQGQYTCPACTKFFNIPSTAPHLAHHVPWYQPYSPLGCPHCTLMEWKPAVPVKRLHVFLGSLPLAASYVLGLSARENIPSLFIERWMGLTTVFALLLIGLMNQLIVKNNQWQPKMAGSWARRNSINRHSLRALLLIYLPLTAGVILVILMASFHFWSFIALLTLFLVSTVFNCLRWLRSRKHSPI